MSADDNRFGIHFRQFGRAALLLPALFSVVDRAEALNWEGHDAWFYDTAPFQEFFENVPAPKPAARPSCDRRRAAYEINRYEQIAIPGVNCIETRKPSDED